jgi:D-serine deaminase-like pyridoxal phosphate-dependent protein
MDPMIGRTKSELDTPALLVDRDKLEHNIRQMAEFFRDRPAKTRPMWKTPKTIEIAKLQLAAGAIGITCAKVSEAELLVGAGVPDVLIANEVAGPAKAARLAALNRTADVKCAVDDAEQAAMLSAAAQAAGVTIGVVVEVFVGLPRCGVKPEDAPALAKIVASAPGLKLRGVMGYEGHIVNLEDEAARRAAAEDSMGRLTRAAQLIRAEGLPCEIVSGGGTGTYNITGVFPGVTEVQVGSYCLMDTKYDKLHLGFEKAVTILASVCSRSPALSGWTIIDAGMKVMSYEFGLPELIGVPGARLAMLSEEHGHLFSESGSTGLRLGDKVELYPSHICTTINLHDRMFVTQSDRVVDVWQIQARGKSQ